VLRKDWNRIRRCVGELAQPVRYASNLAWTMVGIAISAVLALLPWQGAKAELSLAAQVKYAWISPALVIAATAAAIIAVFGFLFARSFAKRERTDVRGILADMDGIHAPAQSSN